MPAARKRTARNTTQDTQPEPKPKPVRLPDGYHGPAYQIKDGRTLFVGRRYAIDTHWSTLFLTDTSAHPEMFRSDAMPVVDTKHEAIANLIAYASQHGLRRVQ